jgi:hypothetical protein
MPLVVPTPGTTIPPAAAAAAGAGGGGFGSGVNGGGGGTVEVFYNSHLTLFDASNKQATFM